MTGEALIELILTFLIKDVILIILNIKIQALLEMFRKLNILLQMKGTYIYE